MGCQAANGISSPFSLDAIRAATAPSFGPSKMSADIAQCLRPGVGSAAPVESYWLRQVHAKTMLSMCIYHQPGCEWDGMGPPRGGG